MRPVKSLLSLLTVVSTTACGPHAQDASSVFATGRPVGEIRGTELVNKVIRSRMLDGAQASTSTFAIEKVGGNDIYSMRSLLGQYADGGSDEFRGGEPNPFGLLMWHQVIVRFAQGVANGCAQGATQVSFFDGSQAKLSDAFKNKLAGVCSWPESAADRQAAAGTFWRAVAGFGAPEEEVAFNDLFAGATSPFGAVANKDRVEAMVSAALLNPRFLLEN